MKLLTSLLVLLSVSTAIASSKARYDILEGKLHKGGSAEIKVLPDANLFRVHMAYEIQKKALVPVPEKYLKDEETVDLPIQFKDERGYLELESRGQMTLPDGVIKFVKKTSFENKRDAFEIVVLPKNGRSKIEVVYHPELPSVGWGQVKVTFLNKNVPLLNNYQVVMKIKK